MVFLNNSKKNHHSFLKEDTIIITHHKKATNKSKNLCKNIPIIKIMSSKKCSIYFNSKWKLWKNKIKLKMKSLKNSNFISIKTSSKNKDKRKLTNKPMKLTDLDNSSDVHQGINPIIMRIKDLLIKVLINSIRIEDSILIKFHIKINIRTQTIC